MTTMKKLASLILAVMMLLSVCAVAGAEGTNTITVSNATKGEVYTIYKLFDLSVNAEKTAYTYKVNSTWSSFFTGDGAKYIVLNGDVVTAIKNDAGEVEESDAVDLANAAVKAATDGMKVASVTAEGTTVAFTGLEDGYYLITSSLGTVAMAGTTPQQQEVTINEKNKGDTIEKKVQEDSTETWVSSNDAQIGDTVYFQSTVTLAKNTRNVKVYDKMDAGLTYNAGSVAIVGLTKGDHYTVEENKDGNAFIITFSEDYLKGLTDATTELTLTYNAVLNTAAVSATTTGDGEDATTTVAIADQKNKTTITYGDAQSVESETTTTTHKFSIFKHAQDSEKHLAGAVFSVKKNGAVLKLTKIDEDNYRIDPNGTETTFTTNAAGDIVIWGADSDSDYALEEITAPDGYNKLTSVVDVTVAAGNATRVSVENKSGATLPSTGGIGTTIFYAVGGLLVVLAVVLLVTKRRVGEEN